MHGSLEGCQTAKSLSLRLRRAGVYEAEPEQSLPPHRHSSWELLYYRSGKARCLVGRQVYEALPGAMLIIPPGLVHSEQAITAYTTYHVALEVPEGHPWPTFCSDDADHSLERVCSALVREWNGHSPERAEMLSLLLQQIDLLLRRECRLQQQPLSERVVERAERLLEERHARGVTIEEVAREVGVSSSSLRSHFGRVRGRTPIQHLHAVRVQHAAEMLRTSSLTLESIASLCGFDSASHLSRHVKRAMGQSPGSLRHGVANGRH
jgi:AraC-like DNA-binding protein